MEATEREKSLAPSLAHHAGEIGEGSDVRELIESEEHGAVLVGAPVCRILDLAEEADDQGGELGLVAARRCNEQRVGALDKARCIELDASGGVERTEGAVGAEDAGSGGPDAGLLALIRRCNAN